ncbi:TRAP-type mannitol/chloroaromatic compound transport system, small permease component [Halomonas korlensis]|uniref:TRAP transporter small permease protein n=2 Tax=Halomonas korlensis TaxID=463301 RepID=A0A1I7IVU1_9GAMM|nr:TRAP-type mannitol/chloroaromatic compound transport system, small permease component [Halomonas korlensis]
MDNHNIMPKVIVCYVRWVDAFNRKVGRLVMLLIFVMMGVLLYGSLSRSLFNSPLVWGIEVSQFLMAAYYLLGGAYSLQMDSHVRMDLFYTRWSDRTRALVDVMTMLLLFVFLGALLFGGISSTGYALRYDETSYTTWGPPLAPIKIIMTTGVLLMLLQCLSTFFKDIARIRGVVIE